MGKRIVCSLGEASNLIITSILGELNNNFTYRPVYIEGPSGIGKTSIIRQSAIKLEELLGGKSVGFYEFNASTRTTSDIWGVPFPVDSKFGGKEINWIKDGELPNQNDPTLDDIGIFYISELTSVEDSQLKVGLLTLLQDRKIAGYTLPDNWFIVADGNGKDDGNIYSPLSFPMRNRMSILEVQYNEDEFIKWAEREGKHPKVIDFIKASPSIDTYYTYNPELEDTTDGIDENNYVCGTPRSWEAVSDYLYLTETMNTPPTERDMLLNISSYIGEDLGKAFLSKTKTTVDNTGRTVNIGEVLNKTWSNNTVEGGTILSMNTLRETLNSHSKMSEGQIMNFVYHILASSTMEPEGSNDMILQSYGLLSGSELMATFKDHAIVNNNRELLSILTNTMETTNNNQPTDTGLINWGDK